MNKRIIAFICMLVVVLAVISAYAASCSHNRGTWTMVTGDCMHRSYAKKTCPDCGKTIIKHLNEYGPHRYNANGVCSVCGNHQ